MDHSTDLVSRILFRAVDEVTAVLKGIAVEMDAVEARVRQTEIAFGASMRNLEAYEVKAAALSREMSGGMALTGANGLNGRAEIVDQYGNALQTVAARSEVAAAETRALAGAEASVAVETARADAAQAKSVGTITRVTSAAKANEAQLKKTASALMLAGGILVGLGVVAAATAGHWDHFTQTIQANTGVTNKELEYIRQHTLQLGRDGPAALDDIAAAYEHAANEGYHFNDATSVVTAGWKAAIATGGKVADDVNAVAMVMRNFHEPARNATRDMGTLLAAAQQGNVHLPDLATNFSKVGMIASAIHMPLADAASVFSALTRATGSATTAQTMWVGLMTHIINPTHQAIDLMKQLEKTTGVDLLQAFHQFAAGQISITQLMEDARKATGGNASEIMKLFGGIRGGIGALKLLGTGWEDYLSISKKVHDGNNQLDAEFQKMQKSSDAAFGTLKNRVQELGIAVGTGLLPPFNAFLGVLVPAVGAIADWAAKHETAVKIALAFGAAMLALGVAIKGYTIAMAIAKAATVEGTFAFNAAKIATLAWAAAQWLLNAALAANPVALVIIAVAALVAAFIIAYTHSKTFREIVNALLGSLVQLATAIETKVIGIFRILQVVAGAVGTKLDALAHMLGISKGDFLALVPVVGPVIELFRHWDDIVHALGKAFQWLGGIIAGFLSALASLQSVPIIGGLIGGAVQPIKDAAAALGHLGSTIDAYAASTDRAKNVTDGMRDKVLDLERRTDGLTASTHKAAAAQKAAADATKAAADASKAASDRMVADAGRIASAWQSVGKTIAAVALALAATTLAGAHMAGAIASRQTSQQYSAAQSQFDRTAQAQIHATAASERGNATTILQNAGHGMSATSSGMDASLAAFKAVIDKLPPAMAAAMGPVIQKYRAEIEKLNRDQAAAVKSEDQRHIQAIQAIRNAHDQALRQHAASVQQAITSHVASFNQSVSTHTAAIRQANTDYTARVKSIHDAYLQTLQGIHGKNAAERRKQAEENYQKHLKAATDEYAKRVKADQDGITAAKKHYDAFLAGLKGKNDAYLAELDKHYQQQLQREEKRHQQHLTDLEKAFRDHVAGLEKALKAASTPTGIVNALSSQLQKNYDKALNQVTLDYLEHHKASQKDIDAVKKAAAQREKLTAAEWDATFKTADAATKAQMLSQRFQGLISQFDTKQQEKAAVGSAKLQILAEKAAAQLDQLKAIETAIQQQTAVMQATAGVTHARLQAQLQATQDQTAVYQAAAGVAQADANAVISAIKDQTAIDQAQAAIDQGDAQAMLAAIKDQTAVLDAQSSLTQAVGNAHLAALKDQGTIAQAQGEIAQAKDAGALRVAQDHLRIAQATYAMDQRQAAYEVQIAQQQLVIAQATQAMNASQAAFDRTIAQQQLAIARDQAAMNASQAAFDRRIAQDQLQVAKDTAAMNRVQARWDIKIAQDQVTIALHQQQAALAASQWTQRIDDLKIQLAQANLVLVKAQNQLQTDQLYTQIEIRDAIGGVNEYGENIQNDLASINAAQGQVAGITKQLQLTQQQAAAAAQLQAILAAQDQQQLAKDQLAKAQSALEWQQKIAGDQQRLAEDQVAKATDAIKWQQKIAQDQDQLAKDQAAKSDDSLAWQQKIAQDQQQLALDTAAKSQASIDDQAKIQQDQNQEMIDQLHEQTTAIKAGNNADAAYYEQIISMQAQVIGMYMRGAIRPMNARLKGRASQDQLMIDDFGAVTP